MSRILVSAVAVKAAKSAEHLIGKQFLLRPEHHPIVEIYVYTRANKPTLRDIFPPPRRCKGPQTGSFFFGKVSV